MKIRYRLLAGLLSAALVLAAPGSYAAAAAQETANTGEKAETLQETEDTEKETAPEMETQPETELPPETEIPPETETQPETELPPETEALPETEIPSETELPPETETSPVTEMSSETELASETEAPTETETEPQTEEYSSKVAMMTTRTATNKKISVRMAIKGGSGADAVSGGLQTDLNATHTITITPNSGKHVVAGYFAGLDYYNTNPAQYYYNSMTLSKISEADGQTGAVKFQFTATEVIPVDNDKNYDYIPLYFYCTKLPEKLWNLDAVYGEATAPSKDGSAEAVSYTSSYQLCGDPNTNTGYYRLSDKNDRPYLDWKVLSITDDKGNQAGGSVSFANNYLTYTPTAEEAGKTVRITVEPTLGYVTDGLATLSFEIEVKEPVAEQDTFFVSVYIEGYGNAIALPNEAKAGEKITLLVMPDAGHRFKEWQVVPGDIIIGEDNTFTMPEANVTVKAIFENAPPILSGGTAVRDSESAATVKFTSSKDGNCYYAVADSGETAPAIDTADGGMACTAGENTVSPADLSGAGAKDLYIVVKDAAGSISDVLKIEIPAYIQPVYSVSADPVTLDFGSAHAGYTSPEARTVTITNTGNQQVTLVQPSAENYIIGTLSAAALAPNSTATFTVQPKEGLAEKTYHEIISVKGTSGGNETDEIEISADFIVNHTLIKTDGKAAACTEEGQEAYWTCSVCRKLFSDENGTKEIDRPVSIPAIGHKAEKIEAKEATAAKEGNIAYWYCVRCGKYFRDEALTQEITKEQTILPAIGEETPSTESETPSTDPSKNSPKTEIKKDAQSESRQNSQTAAAAKTGDETSLVFWLLLMGSAGLCIIFLGKNYIKNRDKTS